MATSLDAANYIDLVRSTYEAYGRGDVATAFSRFHPEIEMVQTPLLPWGGVHRGHDGVRNFFRLLAEHTDGMPTPETFIPAGDNVAVIGHLRGTARKTGNAYDMPIVHVWTIKDGLLVRFAAFIDTPAMLAALEI